MLLFNWVCTQGDKGMILRKEGIGRLAERRVAHGTLAKRKVMGRLVGGKGKLVLRILEYFQRDRREILILCVFLLVEIRVHLRERSRLFDSLRKIMLLKDIFCKVIVRIRNECLIKTTKSLNGSVRVVPFVVVMASESGIF